MRFVHVADVHLDSSFAGRSDEVRQRLRSASREAFRRAVDLAVSRDVDAFLIAGDLFDGERLSFRSEHFLLDEMARLGDHGITVVYATGNHDPGGPASGPRGLRWPLNVVTATDAVPRRVRIPSRGGGDAGWVTAVGHETDREGRDLSRLLPAPEGDLPQVALLHTQVRSSPGAERHHAYAPSDLAYLRRAGFDYWALGHVHVPQALSADPPVWYAGSLQGRGHGEPGERGALLVDLGQRDAPEVTFHPLAPVRWETLRVGGLDDVRALEGLEARGRAAWKAARAADPGAPGTEWMLRVALEGPCPLWAELRVEEDRALLARELRDRLGVLDVVVVATDVHPVIDLEEHRGRMDVLGEALRLAEEVRAGRTELPGVRPEDLAGIQGPERERHEEWIRALLSGADGELAARLLERDALR